MAFSILVIIEYNNWDNDSPINKEKKKKKSSDKIRKKPTTTTHPFSLFAFAKPLYGFLLSIQHTPLQTLVGIRFPYRKCKPYSWKLPWHKLRVLPEITVPPFSPGHVLPSSRWHRRSGRCGVSRTRDRNGVSITPGAGRHRHRRVGGKQHPDAAGMQPPSSRPMTLFKAISSHPFLRPQVLKQSF